MHKVAEVDLNDITQPTKLFIQPEKIDPMDLANNKTALAKNH